MGGSAQEKIIRVQWMYEKNNYDSRNVLPWLRNVLDWITIIFSLYSLNHPFPFLYTHSYIIFKLVTHWILFPNSYLKMEVPQIFISLFSSFAIPKSLLILSIVCWLVLKEVFFSKIHSPIAKNPYSCHQICNKAIAFADSGHGTWISVQLPVSDNHHVRLMVIVFFSFLLVDIFPTPLADY